MPGETVIDQSVTDPIIVAILIFGKKQILPVVIKPEWFDSEWKFQVGYKFIAQFFGFISKSRVAVIRSDIAGFNISIQMQFQ